MSSERKLKDATAYKDSRSPTPSEEELDQEWEPYLSPKSEKNIKTESSKPSQSSHPLKSQTQSLNHTMPPYQFTYSLTQPMKSWSSITKPYTISVSEP